MKAALQRRDLSGFNYGIVEELIAFLRSGRANFLIVNGTSTKGMRVRACVGARARARACVRVCVRACCE